MVEVVEEQENLLLLQELEELEEEEMEAHLQGRQVQLTPEVVVEVLEDKQMGD